MKKKHENLIIFALPIFLANLILLTLITYILSTFLELTFIPNITVFIITISLVENFHAIRYYRRGYSDAEKDMYENKNDYN